MNKLYYPINWENYPSEATPVNESNLNKIDSGLNNLDNRVIEQDAIKLSKTDASNDIVNWTMDEETGVITITRRSGEQILFDLNIEKIPVSFSLSDDGILTMVTDDGTTFTANIGAMIPILTFSDSDEIAVTATGTGINKTYSFSIKDNSIKENKLQPNFLADIKVQSANASASASSAASSANDSSTYATQSKSYAAGGTGTRTGEDTDNAKYYNEQAQQALSEMQKSQVTGVKGDNETEFRTGEVNLTSEDIGAVAVSGDVAENIVTYASNDVGPDGDPALWEIPKLTTGENLSSIMQKVSRIANNFRYMIKLLGTTDISSIGDGTVTGGISTLNDNLTTHKHTKSQITDFPSSLPANGGNSDTVDNFHIAVQAASNLSFSYPVIKDSSNTYKLARTDYVTQGMLSSYPPGIYWINGFSSTISDIPPKLKNSHFMLLVGGNNSSKGFTIQIAIGNAIYMRANAGSVDSWAKITLS